MENLTRDKIVKGVSIFFLVVFIFFAASQIGESLPDEGFTGVIAFFKTLFYFGIWCLGYFSKK